MLQPLARVLGASADALRGAAMSVTGDSIAANFPIVGSASGGSVGMLSMSLPGSDSSGAQALCPGCSAPLASIPLRITQGREPFYEEVRSAA